MAYDLLLLLFGALALGMTFLIWLHGRRRHDRRMRWSVPLRAAAIVLFVLALAEPYWRTTRARMAVVSLIDVSESVADAMPAGVAQRLRPYLDAMPTDSEIATVVFGGDPAVVQGFSPPSMNGPARLGARLLNPPVERGTTDIESALALAADLLPPSGDRRILLVSDGSETYGDASALIPRLRAEGIVVTAVPVLPRSVPNLRVEGWQLPGTARQGTRINGKLLVDSTIDAEAVVRVVVAGETQGERRVRIAPGRQTIELPIRFARAGQVRVTGRLLSSEDARPEDDAATAYVRVLGDVRALYVQGNPEGSTAAETALLAMDGVRWTRVSPTSVPASASRLAAYDVLVFDNVPADALTEAQMSALASYVHDLGGGWFAIGGPRSFGAGDWQGTPLEAASPVEMIPQDQRRPLALMLLLDKSGSMAHESGGVEKLTLAAWATRAAIDALGKGDRIGVIAFDAKVRLVVPLSAKSDRTAVLRQVDDLKPGSGTEIAPALERARTILTEADFPRKHVILLSDGQSEGDLVTIARDMAEKNITVSAIAVGVDARPVLKEIAEAGRGTYYVLENLGRLPRVFAREARQRGEVLMRRETPVLAEPGGPVSGDFPALHGYIAATPKPAAQLFLKTDEDDPILVGWRDGLGKALALLTDGGNRWARAWAERDDFAARLEGMLRWALPNRETASFDLLAEMQGAALRVRVEYPPSRAVPPQLSARVRRPDGAFRDVALRPSGNGAEADIRLDEAGDYEVVVADDSGETASRTVSYGGNAEFLIPWNPALLRRLSVETGGAILPEPASWARPRREGVTQERRLSGWLLLMAFVLVIVEWIVRQLGWFRVSRAARATRSPLSSLMAAKQRVAPSPEFDRIARFSAPHDRPPVSGGGLTRLRSAKSRARA